MVEWRRFEGGGLRCDKLDATGVLHTFDEP
jgi:hypothetical protein